MDIVNLAWSLKVLILRGGFWLKFFYEYTHAVVRRVDEHKLENPLLIMVA